jgi:hypothetical protein
MCPTLGGEMTQPVLLAVQCRHCGAIDVPTIEPGHGPPRGRSPVYALPGLPALDTEEGQGGTRGLWFTNTILRYTPGRGTLVCAYRCP